MTGTINFGAALSGDFVYSGMALQDIKGGKIATMQVERANFTVNTQQAGKADKMTGEIANLSLPRFRCQLRLPPSSIRKRPTTTAITASTARHRPVPTPSLQRWACACASTQMTIDDVGVRPSRLQLPALLAMIQAAGATSPTPAQTRELIDKMATLYEGMRIGTAEMRGLSAETPQGPFKLQAIRFNLEDGKIGEFAVEGLDTSAPKGPVKIGRFALKSLDIANFMRMSAQFANPAQPPTPELIAGLFPLIGGVEIKGVVAPFKNTGKFVNLDGFDVNWGQFVGPIPSKVRLTAKMTTPVDATDPSMKALIAAGLDTLSADGDIGAEWTEAARSFVVDVPKLEIGGLAESIGARRARQRAAAGIFGQRGPGDRSGGADRGRRDRAHAARSGLRRSRGRPICPHTECQPRGRTESDRSKHPGQQHGRGVAIPMRGRQGALVTLCREPGANAGHQADAARQGAGDAAFPVVEDRPADCAGAIPDRGFDGAVS